LTLAYNSPDQLLGGVTHGGYSDSIVIKDKLVPRKGLAIKENGKPNKGMQKWKYFIDQEIISI